MKGSFCKCEMNYGGQNCEIKLADEQCNNQGIQFINHKGHKKCLCNDDYVSDNCDKLPIEEDIKLKQHLDEMVKYQKNKEDHDDNT